jgi:hypothetical protein
MRFKKCGKGVSFLPSGREGAATPPHLSRKGSPFGTVWQLASGHQVDEAVHRFNLLVESSRSQNADYAILHDVVGVGEAKLPPV